MTRMSVLFKGALIREILVNIKLDPHTVWYGGSILPNNKQIQVQVIRDGLLRK